MIVTAGPLVMASVLSRITRADGTASHSVVDRKNEARESTTGQAVRRLVRRGFGVTPALTTMAPHKLALGPARPAEASGNGDLVPWK